ncbi:YveK family protein [Paraclostridium bifermentans]|uniref:YveK family protein n=1 Tax=Paraclostridium bifermentans TaxID=1490 RepID=UPI001476C075|nr:Wzz/FepE/Etk N-terminal domain-containing protein [Paraclostridium bifermentans]MDV8108756.1 Wzz/FepE/Etk N-terminal domain-containing protein [Bacillus sp. BAU-SS-2023]GKZ04409.1 capsular polysaccharide biosynthesis protein [Paraclostridium bifermentans]GKZ08561.1 capsular polysaccharide biosynthesis protein [Paraclostridium bifermentans]GKZ11126.1 capsular polysaccharide biosynthesis protein [Paraclostridium bifermentans]
MEETIDLKEYFQIIKKRAWIIVLITSVAVIVSGIISFFVLSPVYESNTTILVNSDKAPGTDVITTDQINVSEKLAVTYGEIIKSKAVLDEVTKSLGIKGGYEEIADKINVSSVNETQIISVSVQDTNPQRAADIANAIPKAFTKEVKRITKANSVKVIDKGIVPKTPIKPNKIMNIAIAAVLGIMISLFVIFLLEYLDNKIKVPQDIEKHLGLPLLGVIPHENKGKKGGK